MLFLGSRTAPAVHSAGTSALDTGLDFPARVLAGANGSLYISDTFAHLVRRLDQDGTLTTVAGTGTGGYGGDGGPAQAAQLDFPMGLALDAAGNLYIADEGNDRIRMVAKDGTISTFAGDGTGGAALGVAAADGDEGPAIAAHINRPYGLAYAGGKLYVADAQHFRVRVITSDSVIHAFAGSGATGSSGDGGPATKATFIFPTGVAADAAGNVYIAESGNHEVRKVQLKGGPRTITTVAGTGKPGFSGDGGKATAAQLYGPFGVTSQAGKVIVADEGNHRIRAIDADGTITTIAGTGVAAVAPPTLQDSDAGAVPAFKHIFQVVLENEESDAIYGSPAASYLNSLVPQAVKLNQMYGAGHASLDNYMAMFSGNEPNPNTELDCSAAAPGCSVPADPNGLPTNLGDQLEAVGLTWKVYAESMPAPCTVSPTAPTTFNAPYAERHNPGLFFGSILGDSARCAAHIVPYEDPSIGLMADLQSEATTPSYSLIVPNSINDGHDGKPPASIQAADDWLAANIPAILSSPAYLDNGLLIITFDEGTSTAGCCGANPGGGFIATLVFSPLAQAGVESNVPYNHYSALRTIEDALGVPLLNHAGDAGVTPFGGDIWIDPSMWDGVSPR